MGKRVEFDTQELQVLQQVIDDDIETSAAYQAHLEADGEQCTLFTSEVIDEDNSLMTDSIVREEVLRRIKVRLEGGE